MAVVVVVAAPFRFDENDPRAMLRHLDEWARRTLTSPEAWASMLERCGQWADYSARNQVLLASYGVAGIAAGEATWARVPSTDGRSCAIRTGEHALPIRAPVIDTTGDTTEQTPRTAATVQRGMVWQPVFAVEQLARRPSPDALAPPAVPRLGEAEWSEAVRVATGRIVGRTPRRVPDAATQLASVAERVPPGAGRVKLGGALAQQAGWLAADRVGLAVGAMPGFDPSELPARERWRTLVDVRHATGMLIDGVSHAIGVDLAASPLPRHELVDDRTVAAGRRNYLAPSDLRSMPLGTWVETGPYSRAEWLARGVAGAVGTAEFMRVNERSYLAVYDTKNGAMWRLETTGRGPHAGLVHDGIADTRDDARTAAQTALRDRFPEIADFIDRHPSATTTTTRHAAQLTLDAGAPVVSPQRANQLVSDAATNGAWDRSVLVEAVGHRLMDRDRHDLASTTDPAVLVELIQATGVISASTILDVLHAEHATAEEVTAVLPTLDLSAVTAVSKVHELWGVGRLDIAETVGATVLDLRDAGCTQTELLSVAPRQVLRSLDARESTWEQIAPLLIDAGYTTPEAVAHLAAHTPTPDAFAAAVTTITADPITAFTAAGRRAQPDDLVALSERYGLDPDATAGVLAAAMVPTDTAIEVVLARCDGNLDTTVELATAVLGVDVDDLVARLGTDIETVLEPAHALTVVDEAALDWPTDDLVPAGVDL